MKLCILAGGLGSRLAEETDNIPKPMVEIGGRPIIWHIMKYFSCFGFDEFVILGGYKIEILAKYFRDYAFNQFTHLAFDTRKGELRITNAQAEDWKVHIVDTGLNTMTGSRILRARDVLGDDTFALTYGDGVANVNISELIQFHKQGGHNVTLTSVRPEARFGALKIDEKGKVKSFVEKPEDEGGWVNGGFMICEKSIFDEINCSETAVLESDVLLPICERGNLGAYKHYGFWKPMDTMRDKRELEKLIQSGKAEWMIW
jgi:glucose-1-phosphate cytidylyltransferase